ncbi:MAG: hypothetical protein OFPII_21840 [Osedax symbiont Rs1]|nr:MAG: hypothetical protein OFPII_21840 [Osedax symbiont Rs1]
MHRLILSSSLTTLLLAGAVTAQAEAPLKGAVQVLKKAAAECNTSNKTPKGGAATAKIGGGGGSGKCHVQDLSSMASPQGGNKKTAVKAKAVDMFLKLEGIDGES